MKILVIEDTHLDTAIAALQDGENSFIFAENYEEGFEHLFVGGIERVITDLFFPSQVNWGEHYFRRLLNQMNAEPEFAAAVEKDPNLGEIMAMQSLPENPSGLAILEHCLTNGIHCVVVTDGNRHHGNLAAVRNILRHLTPFNTIHRDPLPRVVYGGGASNVAKGDTRVWVRALKIVVEKEWCE